jgi:outer membrane receptor protein involved in Fe transport
MQPLADIPQRVELIDGAVVSGASSWSFVDVLKKSASVDVIQYPTGSSGIGLRGFRPEYSGVNQHVLILIDGRPSGVTGLGTLPMVAVDRVEILKGPASSLYGASAMGGVVNIITRRSSGPVGGSLQANAGSFETGDIWAGAGGGNPARLDFDVAARVFIRDHDTRLGNGETWEHTKAKNHSGLVRLGRDLGKHWRIDIKAGAFLGRDVENPGAYSGGGINQTSLDRDQYHGDLRLAGQFAGHAAQVTVFGAYESEDTNTQTKGASPYLSSRRKTDWRGMQIQDSWRPARWFALIGGFDYNLVGNKIISHNADGTRKAPYTPDNTQTTTGVFIENIMKFLNDRLVLNAGARHDNIKLELNETPYSTGVTPGTESFNTFNPRAGIVYRLDSAWRVHATAGRAFVAPSANQVAGRTEEVVGGQMRVAIGNPAIAPESSATWDAGIGYERSWIAVDLTYFHTGVKNMIGSKYTINTTAYRETHYYNADTATQSGIEAQVDLDFSRWLRAAKGSWMLHGSATRLIGREQHSATNGDSVIRNVAGFKLNASLSWRHASWRAGVSARHVTGMWDEDNSTGKIYTNGTGGLYEYPSFIIWDASIGRYFGEKHSVWLKGENLTDRFYYEKGDYYQPGFSFSAGYRYHF